MSHLSSSSINDPKDTKRSFLEDSHVEKECFRKEVDEDEDEMVEQDQKSQMEPQLPHQQQHYFYPYRPKNFFSQLDQKKQKVSENKYILVVYDQRDGGQEEFKNEFHLSGSSLHLFSPTNKFRNILAKWQTSSWILYLDVIIYISHWILLASRTWTHNDVSRRSTWPLDKKDYFIMMIFIYYT